MRPLAWSLVLACGLALAAGSSDARAQGGGLVTALAAGDDAAAIAAVRAGAPADEPDACGYTPLHVAAERGALDLVLALLARRAAVDARLPDGTSPLMLAAAHGHLDVARVLLLRGARADALRDDGADAAALAARGGFSAVVRLIKAFAPTPHAPAPRKPRTPALAASASPSAAWQPAIPPWSPEPLRLALPDATERFASILKRIDDAVPLPPRPTPPSGRSFDRWVGEKFLFLPADPGEPHDFPSFEAREDVSAYGFDPSYQALAGRIGVVVEIGRAEGRAFADIRLDGEPVVVRGFVRPSGEIPEIAPVLDIAIARRLYLDRWVRPRGVAIGRYHLPAGRPLRVVAIAPASRSANPIRLLVEQTGGRNWTIDGALSSTNIPIRPGGARSYPLAELLELLPLPAASAAPRR